MKNLSEIKKNIKKDLNRHIKEVSTVKTIGRALKYEIKFADILSKNKDELVLDDLKTFQIKNPGRYLYILSVDNKKTLDGASVKFKVAKKANRNRAFARINEVADESTALYVGSSKNLKSRIKQHFGLGSAGTYALQMSYWCKGLRGSFNLIVYAFDKDIETEIIQTIEDAYSKELQPIFGKRGAV